MKAIIAATLIGVILMVVGVTVKSKRTVTSIASVLLFLLVGVNIWDVPCYTCFYWERKLKKWALM